MKSPSVVLRGRRLQLSQPLMVLQLLSRGGSNLQGRFLASLLNAERWARLPSCRSLRSFFWPYCSSRESFYRLASSLFLALEATTNRASTWIEFGSRPELTYHDARTAVCPARGQQLLQMWACSGSRVVVLLDQRLSDRHGQPAATRKIKGVPEYPRTFEIEYPKGVTVIAHNQSVQISRETEVRLIDTLL